MSFLTPWYFLGAALIAGPIIFHLIKRSTQNRVEFSATRFLRESPPRLEKRSAVQNPWLLLLRCLIVLLIAASFARPFIKFDTPLEPSTRPSESIAIVIDQSASMQREGIQQAIAQTIQRILTETAGNDALTLIGISDAPETILRFEEWSVANPDERRALIESKREQLKPTFRSSALDLGILAALEAFTLSEESLSNAGKSVQRIHLISDFSAGSKVSDLAGVPWPANTSLKLETVGTDSARNIGITWMGWSGLDRPDPGARLAIISSPDTPDRTIEIQLFDTSKNTQATENLSVFIPSGQTQMIVLPIPKEISGPFEARLIGDSHAFDNQTFFTRPQPRKLALNYLGEADQQDSKKSAFYISKAADSWKDPQTTILTEGLSVANESPTLHIVDRALSSPESALLRDKLLQGDTAIVLVSEPERLAAAAQLADTSAWAHQTSKYEDALLGSIDFESPMFSPFADPRYNDFSKIRFWNPHPFTPPPIDQVKTIAAFDDGNSAVALVPIGQGNLIVWGSDWTPQTTQWPLSSKFPAWLHNVALQILGGTPKPRVAPFGSLRAYIDSQNYWLNQNDEADRSYLPDAPGIHTLVSPNENRTIAVNTPRTESDVSVIENDVWEQLGIPLKQSAQPSSPENTASALHQKSNRSTESQQNLWRWIILAVLFFLAVESVFAKQIAQKAEGAPSQ